MAFLFVFKKGYVLPSPIAHSLLGLIIFHLFKRSYVKWNIFIICIILFASNLPDLDFIPGILAGEPNRYHHGISHSFGFVLILSGIIFFIAISWDKTKSKIITGWFILLSSLHIILDFFAHDTIEPFGELLFWPVWNSYIISPIPIFFDIRRSKEIHQFISSLFSLHNLKALTIEIIFFLIIWILLDRILKLKNKNFSV